jgi:tripartite-type tricarboxylate transporter receptor subunit TctC
MVLAGPHVQAQEPFPKRSVTIVVPYSAGGVTDYFARQIAFKLSKTWGQPVIVDNRAGAGTIIGTQMVSRAPADGYTLLFTSYGFTANAVLRKNLPYSAASFRPVAMLGSSHNVLLVTNRLRGKSLKELLEDAKSRPGSLKLASSGLGSSPHIGAELFAKQVGIDFVHVPYKGQGPAMSDLIAGSVDGMLDGMSSYSQVKGGRRAGDTDLPRAGCGFRVGYMVRPHGAGQHSRRHRDQDQRRRAQGLEGQRCASTDRENRIEPCGVFA